MTAGPASPAPLYMIRADINLPDFRHWAGGSRRLLTEGNDFDAGYAMHCLLNESFGNLAPQPFRLIMPRDRDDHRGDLYGYAGVDAAALHAAAGMFADPLQKRILTSLDGKAMPTVWQPGTRLGFETLVRPVVRRSRRSDNLPGKEVDAFLLEAEQQLPEEMQRSREDVYRDWLERQLQTHGAALLEEARLRSFQRTRVIRKLHGPYSEGPDAVMQGVLTITDGDSFASLLARGVGRHRAYGYGMILPRPVWEVDVP